MSQSDLAKELGKLGIALHPSAIAKMELREVRSPRTIRLNEAEAIAKILGTTVSELTSQPLTRYERAADLLEMAARGQEKVDEMMIDGLAELGQEGFFYLSVGDREPIPELDEQADRILNALVSLRPKRPKGIDPSLPAGVLHFPYRRPGTRSWYSLLLDPETRRAPIGADHDGE